MESATTRFIEDAVKLCAVCSERIVRDRKLSAGQWERKKYCSFQCGGKALNKRLNGRSWNRGKKCPQLAGENSHLWKGGISPANEAFRKSAEYRAWRLAVFQRDDYTCQGCGKRGRDLEADHVMPYAYFPDMRLDVLNGQTLCKPCHRKTDTYGERAKAFIKFEESLLAIE